MLLLTRLPYHDGAANEYDYGGYGDDCVDAATYTHAYVLSQSPQPNYG